MRKPIIGVTTGEDSPRCPNEYAKAVQEAGAQYKYLDSSTVTPQNMAAIVASIDGLLLTGGKDVHPDYYSSRSEPGDEEKDFRALCREYRLECDPARDAYEIPLTYMAYSLRVPILGICRGLQVLNVALGGSLVKDIRTGQKHWAYRENEQSEGKLRDSRRHRLVRFESDSLLARILDINLEMVNSRHHQGVMEREKSERLTAVAFAEDGIVEAVESIEHPWALAVQWHPERHCDEYIYEPCRPLFRAFVEAATER